MFVTAEPSLSKTELNGSFERIQPINPVPFKTKLDCVDNDKIGIYYALCRSLAGQKVKFNVYITCFNV